MTTPKLENLIKDWKFYYVNPDITDKNFPEPKEIRDDYKLYHFDKYISSEDAVKEMEKDGYSPANLYELLSWKDWNGKDWVGALGSVAEVAGFRHVPCLYEGGSERRLRLGWWDNDWDGYYRFLACKNGSNLNKPDPLSLGDLEKRVKSLENKLERISKLLK